MVIDGCSVTLTVVANISGLIPIVVLSIPTPTVWCQPCSSVAAAISSSLDIVQYDYAVGEGHQCLPAVRREGDGLCCGAIPPFSHGLSGLDVMDLDLIAFVSRQHPPPVARVGDGCDPAADSPFMEATAGCDIAQHRGSVRGSGQYPPSARREDARHHPSAP